MIVDVSIVLNAHREGWIIQPTILSLKRARKMAEDQGLVVEIIAALDRSDDFTKNVVYENLRDCSTIELLDFGDLGLSRNYAVDCASGECVAFIDGDDLWSSNWLIDAFRAVQRSPRKCIFHPEVNVFFENDTKLFFHRSMKDDCFDKNFLIHSNYWTALSFSRRSTYELIRYRGVDLANGIAWEDWQWNIDTLNYGISHEIIPGTTHFIRIKAKESLMKSVSSKNCLPVVPVNFFNTDS